MRLARFLYARVFMRVFSDIGAAYESLLTVLTIDDTDER